MGDVNPRGRGLSPEQNALINAWCALYVAMPLLGNQFVDAAPARARALMTDLREKMTGEASHRCALWEERYWRQRAQRPKEEHP